ncbi:MAG: hypothetical protein ACOZFS_09945 [Thermodesulfobacteriota bacterium]
MVQFQPDLYKAGLFLELHRFKNPERRDRGWDLSLEELRALSTITILLAQTNYKGNEPPEQIKTKKNNRWKRLKEIPVLSFSWNEYLDLYYGRQFSVFGYQGQQATIPKRALALLQDKQLKIKYYVKSAKYWMYYTGPIIIDQNSSLTKGSKKRRVVLEFHPIFIDLISDFYVLKPKTLVQDIQQYLKKNRFKKAVLLFIEWLITKNKNPTIISKDKLIERLWLKSLQESSHIYRLNETLEECYDTAKGLGYLLEDVNRDGFGNLSFKLNPQKCTRLGKENKQP